MPPAGHRLCFAQADRSHSISLRIVGASGFGRAKVVTPAMCSIIGWPIAGAGR